MKFHCSEFKSYKGTPYSWCDLGKDPVDTIKWYFENILRVHDADNGDDESYWFVFENGDAYRLDYSYAIVYEPDWHIEDDVMIERCSIDEAVEHGCLKTYRDIIPKHCHNAMLNDYVV